MTNETEQLQILLLKARENSVACLKPVLSKQGLTEQQWRVLRVLNQQGEVSAQDLARNSCILSPSLSRILARLEGEGLVLRKVDSSDQRALILRLSAKGRRLHDRIAPRIEKQYQMFNKKLGRENMQSLVGLLKDFPDLEKTALTAE